MTILYSNGCSFTANNWIEREKRYPILIGNHFGWTTHDRAMPGTCNTKIIRCTMRDCLNLIGSNKKIIALVQLTFKERWEYAGDPMGPNSWQYRHSNDQFETIKPGNEANWPSEIKSHAMQVFLSQKANALYAQLFSQLLGLVSFFNVYNIDYRIFVGPQAVNYDLQALDKDVFYQTLNNNPGILNLETFNMLSLTGAQKHPDEQGMKKIANHFINLLGEPV
jgi:hypothetical protein